MYSCDKDCVSICKVGLFHNFDLLFSLLYFFHQLLQCLENNSINLLLHLLFFLLTMSCLLTFFLRNISHISTAVICSLSFSLLISSSRNGLKLI